jgi:ADP-ribosylglycohydrolase
MTNISQDKIKFMLLGTIIGDALGTPLDGLGRQHIKAIYKGINGYTDAGPALKGKLDQWKKPGLYSSASQLMLLLAMHANTNRHVDTQKFMQYIKSLPDTSGNEYGIFRHSSSAISHFIQNAKTANNSSGTFAFSGANADTAIILISLAIPGILRSENYITEIISISLMLNKDMHSVAGNLIINSLLRKIITEDISENILNYAADLANALYIDLEVLTPKLFELGIFPDYLLKAVKDFSNIFSLIKDMKDINAAEKTIYTYVNTKIKTPVTRATVNHPLAIIPFSIYFVNTHIGSYSQIILRAAELGGSASILCALTGALIGAANGIDSFPENLQEELINKKRIQTLVEAMSSGKISDDIVQDFLHNEAALTLKEIQEKSARLKHVKIKTKKTKSRQEKERQLSAHVVESWTKMDKAKWKKKSKKNPHFKDGQSYNENSD